MKRFTMVLAGATMAMAVPAAADTMPAQVLSDICKQTTEESVAVCSAYFMGILEGMAMNDAARAAGKPVCAGAMTPMDARAAFMKHTEAYPEMLKQDARATMTAVMAEHPCPK